MRLCAASSLVILGSLGSLFIAVMVKVVWGPDKQLGWFWWSLGVQCGYGTHYLALPEVPLFKIFDLHFFSFQLHSFLRSISFNNSAGDRVSFDENGELVSGFDIVNWVLFPNKSFLRVKVGGMDPQALPDQKFTVNEKAITWHRIFNQVGSKYRNKIKFKLVRGTIKNHAR